MNRNFTEKQNDYFKYAKSRWNIKSGATRSGKTYMDYYLIPKRIRAVHDKAGLVVLLGNTKGTLQRNIIEPLQDIWGTDLVSDIRSDNTAFLFGDKVYCLGADKISQVNRIRGASIKYCYGDEVVTWHKDIFTMLKSRLDKSYSIFDGTCNPDSPDHWFKEFIDTASKKDIDLYLQNYSIDDNPYCEIADQLKKEYAGTVYYDRYILGLWVRAEGLIYRQYADNPSLWNIDITPEYMNDIDFIAIGIDFGGTNSLTTFVATGIHRNYSKLTVLQDYHIKGKKGEIDSDRVNNEFTEFVERLQTLYPNKYIKYAFADSAEQYLINGLRKACRTNFPTLAVKDSAKHTIKSRIICTNTMLNTNRLFISNTCKHLPLGLRTAVWDSKKTDTRLDNFTTDIDILDGFEYSWERFNKKLIPTITGGEL